MKKEEICGGWPVSGRRLDIVKVIAAGLMLLDHIDYMILGRSEPVLMLLGRGAFPLFAYAAACAIVRGGESAARGYGLKIGLIAILIEPIVRIARGADILNILFTLAVGAMFIPLMARLSVWGRGIFYGLGLCLLAYPNIWEFGVVGILLPSAFYVYLKGHRDGGAWAVILMAGLNFSDFGGLMGSMNAAGAVMMVLTAAASVCVPLLVLYGLRRPVGDEKKRDGKRILPKYFLHIFYPVHFVVLALLRPFL